MQMKMCIRDRLSTVLSPMTAYAAEIRPEEKPPLYEEVKDLLDEDEVVTAKEMCIRDSI